MAKYAIGLDYGTLSVRALLIDIQTGEEIASSVFVYPHGVMETELPSGKKLPGSFALQHPQDYLDGLIQTVRDVLGLERSECDEEQRNEPLSEGNDERGKRVCSENDERTRKGVCSESDEKQRGKRTQEETEKQWNRIFPEDIVGIGIDFTASTILPVKADRTPLCQLDEFADEPHAYVKLWKHHGGEKEAQEIDRIAKERGEEWLSLYGGKVSSEWMIPKILETVHRAPEVYQAADRYVEALDWIIWNLTGEESRSACGAGYKAFYHHETGYPGTDFFRALDPAMEHIVEEKLDAPIRGVGTCAGYLTEEMADRLGLCPGTPVGTGIIDAHAAVIGSGVSQPGTMMIIVGTSSCHMLLAEKEAGIPGVAGIVKDGILPGYFAYEAGQCCVGDHFDWFVKNCVPAAYEYEAEERGISIHQLLTQKLEGYRAGQSGLLALDWFNGVRSPLMDFNLNGLMLGMNLQTKPEEMYLALIEATAYGTRMIIESFESAGVPVKELVLGGGIPKKNPMLVQVYADVCRRPVRIASSPNASALGAAILGIAAAVDGEKSVPGEADKVHVGYKDACEAAAKLGKIDEKVYQPDAQNAAVYDRLYAEYKILHEYFGKGANDVMKRLNAVREEA